MKPFNYEMPDAERLVLLALRAAFPGVRCAVYLPTDWQKTLRQVGRLLIARRVGGNERVPGHVDSGMFNVQCYALSRRDASEMARQARAALRRAARDQFAGPDGHLQNFREVTGPFMTTDPLTEAQPDFYRFTANYMIDTRPRR
ncbi:phage tail termination protein [Kitasatospora sp. NPDC001664]